MCKSLKLPPSENAIHNGFLGGRFDATYWVFEKFGRSERIRTSHPLVRTRVRYQAALHSDDRMSKPFCDALPTKSEADDHGIGQCTGLAKSAVLERLVGYYRRLDWRRAPFGPLSPAAVSGLLSAPQA